MKGSSSQFFYDGNHQRWKHVAVLQGSATETTTYIGKFFEKVLLPTGITAYRHYIPAGTSTVLYERSTAAVATYYLTNDHLGSPNFVTTATGSVLIAENFAALGYRLSKLGAANLLQNIGSAIAMNTSGPAGFWAGTTIEYAGAVGLPTAAGLFGAATSPFATVAFGLARLSCGSGSN